MQGLVALIGGAIAAAAHATKASTRVVVNASPEPVSNWILSLAEDGLVVGLGVLILTYPVAALAVTVFLLLAMATVLGTIGRVAWRRLVRNPAGDRV
jgi:hypothetical protein